MAPEGTIQVSKEVKPSTVLPSHDTYEPQQPAWHDNPKAIIHVPWQ